MRKIVLLCNAGLSTSMLVDKMRKEAEAIGYECTINAYPVAEVHEEGKDADIILLGPQVRYQAAKVKEVVTCPVESIPPADYGRMDGKKVLMHAKGVIGD